MEKTNLLFLLPGPIYRPDLPDFKDKYVMLSQRFKGVILTCSSRKEFKDYRIGNFIFQPLLRKDKEYLAKFKLALFMIIKGFTYHYRRERFKVIISYEPLSTGIVGVILKYLLGCRLIIEINGDLLNAAFLEDSPVKRIKRIVYKVLICFSLMNSDSIKLLNKGQRKLLGNLSLRKIVFNFHDFVPTHYFIKGELREEKCILFVGFPFYLKGVDILIKAFRSISYKYPDFILKLVGYRLQDDARRHFHNLNGKIEFCLPRFYDRLREEFLKCYCLVLPSRQEGMGRVLLEAMSSGKPVIGAKVGGIPEIINDGANGFLFERENVNELAFKLDMLLGNPALAKKMGEFGKRLIEEKLSSEKYCESFKDMVHTTVGN